MLQYLVTNAPIRKTVYFLFLFFTYFIDYAITVVPFFLPFTPFFPVLPLPPAFPHFSSCPWFIHKVLWFLHFPYYSYPPLSICTYHLSFLFPVPFPPVSSLFLPNNLTFRLYFCKFFPVLVVCLVDFFFLDLVVDSCEFVDILLFVFLVFFFLDKSL